MGLNEENNVESQNVNCFVIGDQIETPPCPQTE